MTGWLALLLVLLLAGTAAAKQPPLDPKEPPPDPPGAGQLEGDRSQGHMSGSVPAPLKGPEPYRHLPMIDESEWVVLATRDKPYWQAGTFDPVLTNACRLGQFATLPLNRMIVRFTADDGAGFLQVVLPTHRHLLFDSRKLARPNETYYFFSTGEPDCQVWIEGKVTPRVLTSPRGTSLPKPDPQALAKKKALIKSWPHQ
jgi:hypothetical protein